MCNPKLSARHLLIGALLAIWCAALSGVSLRLAPEALLVLHLVSGIGGAAPIAAFLSRHWWARRHAIKTYPNAIQGYVALACLALLALTGLALIRWTNVPALRWLHTGTTAALLLDLTIHMAWRLRLRWSDTQRHSRPAPAFALNSRSAQRWLAAGLVAACGIGALALVARVSATPEREARVTLQHASLGTSTLVRAQDCELCHSDITQQWRRSGHAHAATDAYYQAVTTLFMQERGAEAVRFCATCHNPVGLMQGEIDTDAAKSVKADGALAYQARKLGITLPISQRAAEGVSCALCHQAARVAESPSNGSLELDVNAVVLPTNALARLSLRAVPGAHRDTLLRPVIQQAELCGSCHNLHLPGNGLAVVENDYAHETGRFLKSVVMAKVIDGKTCRFFSDHKPYRLERFNRQGKNETLLPLQSAPRMLAELFQIPDCAGSQPDDGSIARLRGAINAFTETGARLHLPYYLSLLARTCGRAGLFDEGLAAIKVALAERSQAIALTRFRLVHPGPRYTRLMGCSSVTRAVIAPRLFFLDCSSTNASTNALLTLGLVN